MKLIDQFKQYCTAQGIVLTVAQENFATDFFGMIQGRALNEHFVSTRASGFTYLLRQLEHFLAAEAEFAKPPRLPKSQERPADVRTLMRLRTKKKK